MLKTIAAYWTSSSDAYDKVIKSQFRNKKTVAAWEGKLRLALGHERGKRILDVGTGPGFFSILLSRMGHRLTAVDAAAGMIEQARRNFQHYDCAVSAYVGDAMHLDQEAEASFDAVVSRDVVWTLPDPAQAYADWYRVLKPGGTLVVFDGNYLYQERSSWLTKLWSVVSWVLIAVTEGRSRSRSKGDRAMLDQLPFVQVMRPEADEQALSRAGFRQIRIIDDTLTFRAAPLHFLKYGAQRTQRFMIIAHK